MINKNPMDNVEMIKKANFLSSQGIRTQHLADNRDVLCKKDTSRLHGITDGFEM